MPRGSLANCKENRKRIIKRSPSVAEIKTEIRKKFKERLRIVRDNVLDKRRILFEEFTTSERNSNYCELKQSLMESYDYPENTDILIAFAEIEDEIKNEHAIQEAQLYQDYLENEAKSLVSNFMRTCSVCDTFIVTNIYETNVVCSLCAKNYFSSEEI